VHRRCAARRSKPVVQAAQCACVRLWLVPTLPHRLCAWAVTQTFFGVGLFAHFLEGGAAVQMQCTLGAQQEGGSGVCKPKGVQDCVRRGTDGVRVGCVHMARGTGPVQC
jgi:hypothetical protein